MNACGCQAKHREGGYKLQPLGEWIETRNQYSLWEADIVEAMEGSNEVADRVRLRIPTGRLGGHMYPVTRKEFGRVKVLHTNFRDSCVRSVRGFIVDSAENNSQRSRL